MQVELGGDSGSQWVAAADSRLPSMLPRRRRRRAPKGAVAGDVSAGGGSKGRSGSLIRVGGVEVALYNHSWYGEVLAELAEFNVDSTPVFTASATYPNTTVAN